MAKRWIKTGLLVMCGGLLLGALVFGQDLASYLRSGAKSVRSAVKENVPTDFELRRARDLLDEIIPEMHANIRLIAQEEVEIAALREDIGRSEEALAAEQQRVAKVRLLLANEQLASYRVGQLRFTREQLKEDLSRRFEQYKEAEMVLAGKERLLATREKSLAAAVGMLEQTKSRKLVLAQKIESLESQYRLVQAASTGSRIEFDNSKLARTEKLIGQIKKRLDVAERVLAHESRFVQPIPIDTIDEQDLLEEVDAYFEGADGATPGEADLVEGPVDEPVAVSSAVRAAPVQD